MKRWTSHQPDTFLRAMEYAMDAAAEQRLQDYFSGIGAVLAHPLRRESFAKYALGLLGEADRKSVEPIAARACPDPARIARVRTQWCAGAAPKHRDGNSQCGQGAGF